MRISLDMCSWLCAQAKAAYIKTYEVMTVYSRMFGLLLTYRAPPRELETRDGLGRGAHDRR